MGWTTIIGNLDRSVNGRDSRGYGTLSLEARRRGEWAIRWVLPPNTVYNQGHIEVYTYKT